MKSKDKKSPKPHKAAGSYRAGISCPIVGIGASAGGLEAFSQLLEHLPADSGFGYVLVQHLDPQHESALAEILARTTAMPVREVTNNLRVEADHVYIIPPNAIMGVVRGVLKLSPRSQNRLAPRSIDFFFEALAKDQGERSIGVILSGNATDGTLGLEAIKAEGGFTFAQDNSARYESMPKSAVAAGCVDLVLSPANISRELVRLAKHPYVGRVAPKARDMEAGQPPQGRRSSAKIGRKGHVSAAPASVAVAEQERKAYDEILLLLQKHCGVDFSLYKSTTVRRRVARRSVLNRRASLKSYAYFLRGNSKELDALYADTLINVTSFFRNAEAFSGLKKLVFSKLLKEGGSEPIRVWVLGCSTGQEAYSIAIAFKETAERFPRARKLQIFATDLNEANLEKARNGFYPKTLAQDVSPERLRRFFVEEDSGYRVIKQLRESIVFARQNVISDPPFSRMDLISCRNVMIYFDASLHKKVIPTFHYALKNGGYLFLGASESVGGFGALFSTVGKPQRIFVKKAAPTTALQLPIKNPRGLRSVTLKALPRPPPEAKWRGGAREPLAREFSAEREADRITVSQFAPAGVLIGADFQVLQFRGRTAPYLEAPTGKATFDVLRMAREGLMLPLRAAINTASRENRTVRRENVEVNSNGDARKVNVEVIPLKNLRDRCFLVLFEEVGRQNGRSEVSRDPESSAAKSGARRAAGRAEDAGRMAALERDLSETRDYLRLVQESNEAANQELQATNEEGQSANEELQSLNEELETSKEELESTNEELTTVNEEMVTRNSELNRLIEVRRKIEAALRTSDERYRALFELGPVGVYSCDASGSIMEFNQYAVALWGYSPKIGDSAERFDGSFKFYSHDGILVPHSRSPVAAVLSGKIPFARDLEAVIKRPDGSRATVMVNIVPLKNDRGEMTGAINCFYDITGRKRSDLALRDAQAQLSKHVGKLESLVFERTSELHKTNSQLVASVESTRKRQEEYKQLFAESLVMQGKLRHLTHLIITTQEEERKKISRELHDEVVQALIAINIELTTLRNGDVNDVKSKIAATQRLVKNSVNAVHRFARGLRPAVLDDLGLIPALHAYCKGLTVKKKLNIEMTAFGGAETLNSAGKTVLFRIAQEALTNVSRHARASQVRLSIGKIGGSIRMEISDNGQSFPVERILLEKNPKRLGLIGMKERLEMVGGALTIESKRGKGTIVRAEIPFTLENAEH